MCLKNYTNVNFKRREKFERKFEKNERLRRKNDWSKVMQWMTIKISGHDLPILYFKTDYIYWAWMRYSKPAWLQLFSSLLWQRGNSRVLFHRPRDHLKNGKSLLIKFSSLSVFILQWQFHELLTTLLLPTSKIRGIFFFLDVTIDYVLFISVFLLLF